jgi:hypothetical protein
MPLGQLPSGAEMPIHELMTRAAVFVEGLYRDPKTGAWTTGPIGTGFIVGVQSEHHSGRQYGYIVTCDHVLVENIAQGVSPAISLRRLVGGELASFQVPLDAWRRFDKLGIDLAVVSLAEIQTSVRAGLGLPSLDIKGINLDTGAVGPDDVGRLHLGGEVLYVGLLAPLKAMALTGTPMVRAGSIGALNQAGLAYSEESDDRKIKVDYNYVGHLIDCRSYQGFSGSPVFAAFTTLNAEVDDQGMNLGLQHDVRLLGIFTGHLTDRLPPGQDDDGIHNRFGVGTVLPIGYVQEALMNNEELSRERAARDAAGGEGAVIQADSGIAPTRVRDRRVTRPKRDMDEPVSLYPLSPEDALQALLNTPRERDAD